MEPFRCEVKPARASVYVRPIGELDLLTVPAVEAQLAELWSLGFTRLALDLRETCFLDSTGLHLVLDWTAHASTDGFAFAVIAGPPQVQRVFELAGVGDLVSWSPDGQPEAQTSSTVRPLSTDSR